MAAANFTILILVVMEFIFKHDLFQERNCVPLEHTDWLTERIFTTSSASRFIVYMLF